MRFPVIVIILALCCIHIEFGQCYSILAIFPLQMKSHYVMFERLLKALVERGHEVDVVSIFPQKRPIPRYNDINIEGLYPTLVNNLNFTKIKGRNQIHMMKFITEECGVDTCRKIFNSTIFQDLKNTKKKYDLLITEIFSTDCVIGFGWLFKIPVISMTSSVNLPWGGDRIGNPDNPSYIPSYFLPYTNNMNLYQRVINTISIIVAKTGYQIFSMNPSNKLAKEFFGSDMPDLDELVYNTSLLMVNSHFSLNHARPTVPNFIEVGGLHIDDPKPLPKHLKQALETDVKKGVIYLSMGSMLLTETFEDDKLQGMFDAFKELPYKVLWKATREKFSKKLIIPDNIHFEPWMPQADILCHPNVKLFISHGGQGGTQESILCGVPRIGMPIFADQELNIQHAERMGVAIKLAYKDISKETVLDIAKRLLEDPKYRLNAERLSKLFRDRPQTPLETAIFWTEYVIRHRGAPGLRSVGADLYWYQYYLVDVILILLAVTSIILLSIFYVVRKILQLFLGSIPQQKQKTR